ncbi:MAG TPA: DUF2125 domain-containing protein [Caulobacteraceae bacterium]|nr:DUF2125 domain-containing protein [Caulobacteraceae bacterium]
MPDAIRPRKRPRRLWLFLPYIAIAVLAVVGAAGWLVEKSALERHLEAKAAALREQGYTVAWASERVDGFPFRLDLTLDQPRIADRAGWALALPQLKGEAYAYLPGNWVFVAPQGLTLTRPGKGDLGIAGQTIRASAVGIGHAGLPRLSLQGTKLTFSPAPGAAPAPIASADLLEMHLQPGPDDQAAFLLKINGGRSPVGGGDLEITWDSRLTQLSQVVGPDWPSAVRHWIGAGGVLSVAQADLDLGGLKMSAKPTPLTVGQDGALQGALPVSMAGGKSQATLTFRDDQTALGPLVIGPAPRVF